LEGTVPMNQEDTTPDLRSRAAFGTFLLLIARLGTKSLDIVMLMVLTRFLLPEDFGLVALAMMVVRMTEAILELTVGVSLLYVPRLTRSHLDTAFTLGLLRGIVISTFLFVLSVPLASFYGDERLVALTCALAIAPAMRGLRSPRLYEQFKALQFGPDSASEIIGKVLAVIAAAAVAVATQSYWAIAVGAIAAPTFQMIASYCISPYRPRLSLRHHRLFHRVFGWGMAAQTLGALNWQGDRLILGKMATQAQLGEFAIARDLSGTAFKLISEVVSKSALAGLAYYREDNARLARAYATVSSVLLAVGVPISVGQACVAQELVAVLLGENWGRVVPIYQAVSLAMIPALYASLTSSLFYATDRPELVFSRNFYDLLFRLPVTVALIMMSGLMGAVVALIASDLFLALICLHSLKRIVGVSILRQLLVPWRSYCSAIVMVAVIEMLRLASWPSVGVVPAIAFLLAAVPLAAISYAATHWLLWYGTGRPEGVESHAAELVRTQLRRHFRRSHIT
jgi:O-antigen/teichoic acid export membrane protein